MAIKKETSKKETGTVNIDPIDDPAYTYEEGLLKLEECVSRLEGGNLSLENSLETFQEGIALIRELSGKLDAMEHKMLMLLDDKDGMKTVEFNESF